MPELKIVVRLRPSGCAGKLLSLRIPQWERVGAKIGGATASRTPDFVNAMHEVWGVYRVDRLQSLPLVGSPKTCSGLPEIN